MKNQTLKYWLVYSALTIHLWIVFIAGAVYFNAPHVLNLFTAPWWGLVVLNWALATLYCYWVGIKRA